MDQLSKSFIMISIKPLSPWSNLMFELSVPPLDSSIEQEEVGQLVGLEFEKAVSILTKEL